MRVRLDSFGGWGGSASHASVLKLTASVWSPFRSSSSEHTLVAQTRTSPLRNSLTLQACLDEKLATVFNFQFNSIQFNSIYFKTHIIKKASNTKNKSHGTNEIQFLVFNYNDVVTQHINTCTQQMFCRYNHVCLHGIFAYENINVMTFKCIFGHYANK